MRSSDSAPRRISIIADTGRRAAQILVRQLQGEVKPVMRMVKIPMDTPASTHRHEAPGPFKRLMEAAIASETGSVLSSTVFYVQPWLDIAEMGFATVVVTDDDPDKASEVAIDLANKAWNERHAFFETKLVARR